MYNNLSDPMHVISQFCAHAEVCDVSVIEYRYAYLTVVRNVHLFVHKVLKSFTDGLITFNFSGEKYGELPRRPLHHFSMCSVLFFILCEPHENICCMNFAHGV